jgi:hypothetical protein
MKHVDANNDFIFMTFIHFKILGSEIQVRQHGVRLVHVDNSDAILLKRNIRFKKNILQSRH